MLPAEAWVPISLVALALINLGSAVLAARRDAEAKRLADIETARIKAELKEEQRLMKIEAKAEADEIKETLRLQTEDGKRMAKDVKATLRLADGTLMGQKLLVAQVARSKAAATNDPADIVDAEKAENIYQQHKESLQAADAAAEAEGI